MSNSNKTKYGDRVSGGVEQRLNELDDKKADQDRVDELADRVESLEARNRVLQDRVDELEDDVEEVRGIGQAVKRLFSNKVFDDLVSAAGKHEKATQKSIDDILTTGEERETVITENPDAPTKDPIAKIEGVVTFVESQGKAVQVGDKVKVRITDIRSNCAQAVLLDKNP